MDRERPFIVRFDAKEPEPSSLVGTKGANLMKLFQAGFPVPDGFCITAEALKKCVEGRKAILYEKMASLDMPQSLKEAILEAYRALLKKYGIAAKVAVRSSAVSEDLAEASFAGQYDTVLNVGSEGDLISAVKKCWASAFSERASKYAANVRIANSPGQMAVIVQVMINPDFAGVLFTRDPLAQDTEQMLVEFTRGLGDCVVAGTKAACQLRVRRDTLKVTDAFNPDPQLNELMQNKINWEKLFKMSLRIEKICKASQDIEWAYGGNAFWILQSRPVTFKKRSQSRQIWSRANAGEILPGVITPLTWSIFKPMLTEAGGYLGKSLLTLHWNWRHPYGEFPDSPGLFNGRAYMELTSVYAGFGSYPGVAAPLLQRMLGFEYHLCSEQEIPVKRSRRHPMDIVRNVCFWLEILHFTHRIASGARRWMKEPPAENSETDQGKNSNPEAVAEEIDSLLKEAARILALHIQCTSLAFSAFGLLLSVIKKYAGDGDLRTFETGLITDFQNISTVTQSIAIWDLALTVKKSPEMTKALFEAQAPEDFFPAVSAYEGSADFMKRWKAFLSEFGERSSQEFELGVAHWDEDASFVLETMRTVIREHAPDPRQRLSSQQSIGSQHIQDLIKILKKKASFMDRRIFNRLLATYSDYVPLRENLKYCVVARFNRVRRRMLSLGMILKRMSLLSDPKDIFFLRYEEIKRLTHSSFAESGQTLSLVSARKKEHDQYRNDPLGDILVFSEGAMIPFALDKTDASGILQGIGCSLGQCTGKAHVVDSVLGTMSVPEGRILVAPSIDPGLTPLFLTAKGLVTEIGGVLSHGATVAREYGLPAVVGVQNATKLIKNGQTITVDGITGKVFLGNLDKGV